MTDHLRALAEAEAEKRYEGFATGGALNLAETAFSAGFIAGRTSVTREQLADAIEGAHKAWHEYWGDFNAGIGDDPGPLADFQADAILALLNGENDD